MNESALPFKTQQRSLAAAVRVDEAVTEVETDENGDIAVSQLTVGCPAADISGHLCPK